jgi:large subunit ribosomal protein L6
MSRIGRQPITVPSGINVDITSDMITITGSKGSLSQFRLEGIEVVKDGDIITVSRQSDDALYRARHGLMRSLINNMVVGVSTGFSKKLEINGVGYRVASEGQGLKLNLGFSHDVKFAIPQGINAAVEGNTITISGISKQQVGQIAAEIRALKKPEPYKGKGIKYEGERIIRKSGKSGKEK